MASLSGSPSCPGPSYQEHTVLLKLNVFLPHVNTSKISTILVNTQSDIDQI